VWKGYTVFQIKQKQRIDANPADNAAWLWGQIRDELEAWATSPKRGEVPDYLFFVTNVALTPTPVSGGHDTINRNIHEWFNGLTDRRWDI
jgi:hypothetical protein